MIKTAKAKGDDCVSKTSLKLSEENLFLFFFRKSKHFKISETCETCETVFIKKMI